MIVSTYNVNSVNARLPNLLFWLEKTRPDIVFLQEIKTEFNAFPFFEINTAGYEAKVYGQKSYNGVAVLSRHKMTLVSEGIPVFADENARYLEVIVNAPEAKIRAASVYLPNGNPPYNDPDDESKFIYKLKFMDALYYHVQKLLRTHEKIILGGDFNVILTPDDVYNPELFKNNALFRPSVRQRLNALCHLGCYDAFRTLHPKENGYTYWDYGGRAYEQDLGMRIDYLFLSAQMADALSGCVVDKTPRTSDKPSDHTALTAKFRF